MSMNIFSSLDPLTSLSHSLSEFMFLAPLVFCCWMLSFNYWYSVSWFSALVSYFTGLSFSSVKTTKSAMVKTSGHFLVSIFVLIFSANMLGMLPYCFCYSSMASVVSVISLMVWLAFLLSSMVKSLKKFAGSMVPSGSPVIISPALCILEVVSVLIRPFSLTLRLVANMTAGHCFLSIISQVGVYFYMAGFQYFVFLMVLYFIYYLLELAICGIQAYILMSLLSLYLNEHPSKK